MQVLYFRNKQKYYLKEANIFKKQTTDITANNKRL